MNGQTKQWFCAVDGQQYGPYTEDQLRLMAANGSLHPDAFLWTEGLPQWVPAWTVPGMFPARPPPPRAVQRHRGGSILALGILGLVVCMICGVLAWVMANTDLRKMAAGRMDRSGEPFTKAGKICGIAGVILSVATFAVVLLVVILEGPS